MVDLSQKGGRAARGLRVTKESYAPLDAFGPSDIREKKSEDLHPISLSPILYRKKAFKYRQHLRAKCPFLYDIANPPAVQSCSLYHPLTIPPTPSSSSTNPFIAVPAPASHSSIVPRFLTFRRVRAIQGVHFRPDLERYMAEHHSGI